MALNKFFDFDKKSSIYYSKFIRVLYLYLHLYGNISNKWIKIRRGLYIILKHFYNCYFLMRFLTFFDIKSKSGCLLIKA